MRCHAYQLPSDGYRELEAQFLEQLRDADRDQLLYMVAEHDLSVELLSGEWRVLFDAAADYYQVVDKRRGTGRMLVSPDELADFVRLLRDRRKDWAPIAFGLAELTDALPAECDLVGVVFIEESDDWLWSTPVNEVVALRPEVFALLERHMWSLLEAGNHVALGRLAADHCEGAIELSPKQWDVLREHARERAPELLGVIRQRITAPTDYTAIREMLALVSDPAFQPSLDAWLRVHADAAQYALYFREAELQLRQLDDLDPGASFSAAV